MAYPMMDVLLLAAAIRLAVGVGRKPPSFWFMIAAIVTLFVTDAIYGWLNLYTANGYQPGQGPLEAGWMAFYVLFARRRAAIRRCACCRSRRARRTIGSRRRRLILLAGASLVAPFLIAYEIREGRSRTNAPVLIGATDRPVHPVGDPHVGPDAQAGGVPRAASRRCARRARPRDRDEPRVDPRRRGPRDPSASPATTRVVRICETDPQIGPAGGRDRARRRRHDRAHRRSRSTRSRTGVETGWSRATATRSPIDESVLVASHSALPDEHTTAFVAPLFTRDELSGILVVSVRGDAVATGRRRPSNR